MTEKEIADRLEKVVQDLEQIDIDLLHNFQGTNESVLMFLRSVIRDCSSLIHKATFYSEVLLRIR